MAANVHQALEGRVRRLERDAANAAVRLDKRCANLLDAIALHDPDVTLETRVRLVRARLRYLRAEHE